MHGPTNPKYIYIFIYLFIYIYIYIYIHIFIYLFCHQTFNDKDFVVHVMTARYFGLSNRNLAVLIFSTKTPSPSSITFPEAVIPLTFCGNMQSVYEKHLGASISKRRGSFASLF